MKVRVEQLVLTVLEGSYLYLASKESLKQGSLPSVLQEISIRDKGLALTKSGDRVLLVRAESAVDKRASRGFIHRHALVLNEPEYESIGGTPRSLLDYVPTYQEFRKAYLGNQRLEAIEIPDSYNTQLLSHDDVEALRAGLQPARLQSILSTLMDNSGRIVLYYEKSSFDELIRLAVTIVGLLPPPLRSNVTFGVDLTFKASKALDLELYRSRGIPSIPSVKTPHRFFEDLASAAYGDGAKAERALTTIHRDFMLTLRDFEEATSRVEAVSLALDSYHDPEFRRWALDELITMKASRAQRLVGEGKTSDAKRLLDRVKNSPIFYQLGDGARDKLGELSASLSKSSDLEVLSRAKALIRDGKYDEAATSLNLLGYPETLSPDIADSVISARRTANAALAVQRKDYQLFSSTVSSVRREEKLSLFAQLSALGKIDHPTLKLFIASHEGHSAKP